MAIEDKVIWERQNLVRAKHFPDDYLLDPEIFNGNALPLRYTMRIRAKGLMFYCLLCQFTLARRVKRTPMQRMDAHNKALCMQMTATEFRSANAQEAEWLIPGWTLKGSTLLLHGDSGAGKTLFAYDAPVFQSLIDGIKVISITSYGQKVKVRNQTSNTDAVFRLEHVRLM